MNEASRAPELTTMFAAPRTNGPFLLAAGRAGLLAYDGTSAPVQRLRELLGPGLGRVGVFFARVNHPCAADPAPVLRRRRYDPVRLAESRGNHPGSTGILEVGHLDVAIRSGRAHLTTMKTTTTTIISVRRGGRAHPRTAPSLGATGLVPIGHLLRIG